MKKLTALLIALSLHFTLVSQAFAAPTWTDWETNGCAVGEVPTIKGFECIVGNLLGLALSFIGLAVFIMIIIAAYRILLSQGDPKGVEAGKNTLTYAIMGLVLALSAWFILNTISTITGANQILIFNLG